MGTVRVDHCPDCGQMVGDLYFHQQKQCSKRIMEDKRLYPRASPLSRALREIAKGKKLSSLQVPIVEDAASHIEELEDRLRDFSNVVEEVMPDVFPDQQAKLREAIASARKW
jgi:hypothetical protein